jgi:hypothetical protein
MKQVIILFFLICSILSGGLNTTHGASHYSKSSHVQTWKNNLIVHTTSTQPEHSFLKTNHAGLKNADSLLITVEDDDEEDNFVKKHLSPAHFFLAFTYAFILSDRTTDSSENLSSTENLSHTSSCKYIFQRTLRI